MHHAATDPTYLRNANNASSSRIRSTGSAKCLLLPLFCLLFMVSNTNADIVFYENFSDWQSNATGTVQELDLFDASIVALADEVNSPPNDNTLLGTDTLTFSTSTTGYAQSFELTLLESPDLRFRSIGTRVGLEPSQSGREDFEQLIGGSGTVALAMQLDEHQATNTVWEFFDASDQSLGSFVLSSGGAGSQFYGVVADSSIARAVVTHNSNENFGIGTQYFSDSAAVPEPCMTPLLIGGIAVWTTRRRRQRN